MSLRTFLGLPDENAPAPVAATGALARPQAPAATGIGLYGKLPSQADFVRINAGGFASGKFDQWLEDGVGSVITARGTPSDALVTFFAYSPHAPNPCMGLLGPSRDKVGRHFPAALFAYLDPQMTGLSAYAGDALGAFLFHAQAIVAALPQTEGAPALDALILPDLQSQNTAAQDAKQQLGQTSLQETLDVVFGTADPQARQQAIATCLAACATAKGQFPDKAAITLELPAADDRARDFWLALVTTALAWPSGAPSWLWDDRADRLLLALGPPSPNLFVALALPDWVGARHWVIRSQSPQSGPVAALQLSLQSVLDTESSTVSSLLDAVAQS